MDTIISNDDDDDDDDWVAFFEQTYAYTICGTRGKRLESMGSFL